MRILLSIHHPLSKDQGAPGVTYQRGRHIQEQGAEARILSFTDMPDGIVLRSPLFQQVRFPWFIARQLQKLAANYDVADCSSGDGWVYQAFQRKNKLLMVARSHGLEHIGDEMLREEIAGGRQVSSWKYPLYHGGYRLWEVARSFRTADVGIFPSDADRSYAVEKLGVTPGKTAVIPNGIPHEFADLPFRAGRPRCGLRLAVVGSYGHRKINVAPQALNALLLARPDLHVGFLGTGVPDEVVLRDYLPEIHSRLTIVRHYAHSSLPALLADYDVLLFPSLAEGFGLVVYEAMACGLAVLATELDALKGYLKHEHDVLFFRRNSPESIQAAVSRLYDEPALLGQLQRNGWVTASQFAWPKIASTTIALYEEHLARKLHATNKR